MPEMQNKDQEFVIIETPGNENHCLFNSLAGAVLGFSKNTPNQQHLFKDLIEELQQVKLPTSSKKINSFADLYDPNSITPIHLDQVKSTKDVVELGKKLRILTIHLLEQELENNHAFSTRLFESFFAHISGALDREANPFDGLNIVGYPKNDNNEDDEVYRAIVVAWWQNGDNTRNQGPGKNAYVKALKNQIVAHYRDGASLPTEVLGHIEAVLTNTVLSSFNIEIHQNGTHHTGVAPTTKQHVLRIDQNSNHFSAVMLKREFEKLQKQIPDLKLTNSARMSSAQNIAKQPLSQKAELIKREKSAPSQLDSDAKKADVALQPSVTKWSIDPKLFIHHCEQSNLMVSEKNFLSHPDCNSTLVTFEDKKSSALITPHQIKFSPETEKKELLQNMVIKTLTALISSIKDPNATFVLEPGNGTDDTKAWMNEAIEKLLQTEPDFQKHIKLEKGISKDKVQENPVGHQHTPPPKLSL